MWTSWIHTLSCRASSKYLNWLLKLLRFEQKCIKVRRKERECWKSRFKPTYFRCFVQSCDCAVTRMRETETLNAEKWFPALAWFVSQIFLLLFCLISPRTFYYWQYLSQDGCRRPVWCEDGREPGDLLRKKLLSIGLLAKRSLQMLIPSHHTNDDWIFFSKILCINILFRGLNWASIMKRRRRWKEYRNRPGEPMSNHYFSV